VLGSKAPSSWQQGGRRLLTAMEQVIDHVAIVRIEANESPRPEVSSDEAQRGGQFAQQVVTASRTGSANNSASPAAPDWLRQRPPGPTPSEEPADLEPAKHGVDRVRHEHADRRAKGPSAGIRRAFGGDHDDQRDAGIGEVQVRPLDIRIVSPSPANAFRAHARETMASHQPPPINAGP